MFKHQVNISLAVVSCSKNSNVNVNITAHGNPEKSKTLFNLCSVELDQKH